MGLDLEIGVNESSGKRALGITAAERISQGHLISRVVPGSDIYNAGVGADDLLLEVDGKKASEVDLDEWANELKPGDEVRLSVLLGLKELKQIEFTYTGDSRSKTYSIQSKKKVKGKEAEMRKDWLETKVK